MNLLDGLIVVGLLSAVVGGFRLGLVARLASWIGGLGGFVLGLRLVPVVLRELGDQTALTRLFVTLALLLLLAAVGGAIGEALGAQVRRAMPPGPVRSADRTGGAVAGAAGLMVGLWLFLPVVADVPGEAARQARNSAILQTLQDVTPRPPDFAQTVRRLVGENRIPDVFEQLRPAPDTGPPPAEVPVDPAVVARSLESTVNIESSGCGSLHEGSGFAVAPDTVVTNAHVVAGADDVRARRPDGRLLRATVVAFDDNRDLAVLSVPGLGQDALELGEAGPGTGGAVLGYPGGQNTPRVAPAVVREKTTAVGRDIYNSDRTRRLVLILAATLRPGDSGSALIDGDGRVVGVVFAIAPDRAGTAYALDTTELRSVLDQPRRASVGPCV